MAFSSNVADAADAAEMADGVAELDGVEVSDGVAVADDVVVTEGGATVTAEGDMLVVEFGGGPTLGGTLGGGTSVDSVDIFVRGGMWQRFATTTEFDYHPVVVFFK